MCREIILHNANENWYIILYNLFSRLWYIATCGPFCKDATHIRKTRGPKIEPWGTPNDMAFDFNLEPLKYTY